MAPKRQRTGKEPASSSATLLDALLQFDQPIQQARCDLLQTFEFTPNRFLDLDVAAQFHLADSITEYIANAGWEHFTAIQFPAYREPTLEFLASLWISTDLESIAQPGVITFRLNNRQFSMSVTDFNLAAGFETEQSIMASRYQEAHLDFPIIFSEAEFWTSITNGATPYNPSQSKASRIQLPALRWLHKFIVHSISGRKDSVGVVTRTDLFYLWCMTTRHQCNIGIWFLSQCQKIGRVHRRNQKGYIAVGSYISYLAHRLDALHPDATRVCDHVPIDIRALDSMGMIRQHAPGRWVLRGMPDAPADIIDDDDPAPPAPEPAMGPIPVPDDISQRLDQLALAQADLRRHLDTRLDQLSFDQNEMRLQMFQYMHQCFEAAGFHPPPPPM